MSWTGIDVDTSWQELEIAQEIATAYNLRIDATGGGLSKITPDQDMTVSDFVLEVQVGIETMSVLFANKTSDLSGTTDYLASFATTDEMMTEAGLTESGYWRRIADGGTQPSAWTTYDADGWSYGRIEDGDLAGPWLFIDLEAALTELTRRVFDVDDPAFQYEGKTATATNSYPSITGTITYPSAVELDGTFVVLKSIYKRSMSPYSWDAMASLAICLRSYTIADLPEINKTISLVGKPVRQVFYADNGWAGTDFGTGWTLDGKTFVLNSISSSGTSVTLKDANVFTSWATFSAYVPWPTIQSGMTTYNGVNIRAYAGQFVVDYDFNP